MILDIPDEDVLVVLLALRRGAQAGRVRRDADRADCSRVYALVRGALESAAGLRALAPAPPPPPPALPPDPILAELVAPPAPPRAPAPPAAPPPPRRGFLSRMVQVALLD